MTSAASTRAEELATLFESASEDFARLLESLAPQQWLTVVPDEQRTVAALARHVAWGFGYEMTAFGAFADGRDFTVVTHAQLDGTNAEHAAEYAECPQPDTIDYLRAECATTAATVRGFSDEALEQRGRYLENMPVMTVAHYLERILVGHILIHQRSIKQSLGLP